MKLLLINYEYPPIGGGAGNATFHIAQELSRLHHKVMVVTSRFNNLPKKEQQNGVIINRIPVIRRRAESCSIAEMVAFIFSGLLFTPLIARRFQPDAVIVFFTIPSGPIALLLNFIQRIPYIVSLRGGDVPGFMKQELSFYHWVTKPLIRLIWRRAIAVVANSQGLQELARKTYTHKDILIIPNGVDVNLFTREEKRVSSHPKVLFVGRLTSQKGVDVLLKAVSEITNQLPELQFTVDIIGDGPQRPLLETMAKELRLSEIVRFFGWQKKSLVIHAYKSADIFVSYPRIQKC